MSAELPPLSLLQRSRLGAEGVRAGSALRYDHQTPHGRGVRLRASCDGAALVFWLPEADWCLWLAPHWALPQFSALDPAWTELAASWTLLLLDDWLTDAGLAPCLDARVEAAVAPAGPLDCLCLQAETRRLPLYLEVAPAGWLERVLARLPPAPDVSCTVGLVLGWCAPLPLVPAQAGEVLPVYGADDDLAVFWPADPALPGRLRLHAAHQFECLEDEPGLMSEAAAGMCYSVEVGRLQLSGAAVWPWLPGTLQPGRAEAYPLARVMARGQCCGLGALLRFEDRWAVQLQALQGPGGNSCARDNEATSG